MKDQLESITPAESYRRKLEIMYGEMKEAMNCGEDPLKHWGAEERLLEAILTRPSPRREKLLAAFIANLAHARTKNPIVDSDNTDRMVARRVAA